MHSNFLQMSIKNSLRFVEYSSVFVLCGFLLMVLSLMGADQAQMHVNLYMLGFSGVLFLIYIFKDKIIRNRLKRSRYKNMFWQILEKIHLSDNILLDIPSEPFQVIWETDSNQQLDAFIIDNSLNTRIGRKRTYDFVIWMVIGIFLTAVFVANQILSLNTSDTTIIAILGLMCIVFSYLFGNYNFFRSEGVALEFTPYGLLVENQTIVWDKVIDWQYQRRDATNNSSIIIYYYNTFLEVESVRLELYQLNARKIDLVLLLSHFKETYGRDIY